MGARVPLPAAGPVLFFLDCRMVCYFSCFLRAEIRAWGVPPPPTVDRPPEPPAFGPYSYSVVGQYRYLFFPPTLLFPRPEGGAGPDIFWLLAWLENFWLLACLDELLNA